MKMTHSCAEPGCPELVEKGKPRCEAHTRQFNRTREVPSSRYSRRSWRVLRKVVLERDNYRCRAEGCDAPATDVDHIVPLRDGGEDEVSNLMSLCRSHHSKKTMREMQESGRLAGRSLPPTEPEPDPRVARNMERRRRGVEMIRTGATDAEVMEEVGATGATVSRWRADG